MPKPKRELSSEFPIHITARSNNREHFFISLPEVWEIFEDYLFLISKGFGIEIISFVLMPNHFHLLLRDPNLQLAQAMQYFMRETSREIARKADRINRIWGGEFSSTVVKGTDYYFTCYKYIYRNPVKANLCKSVFDYPFSTLQGLLGERRSIIPLCEDLTLFDSLTATIQWLDKPFEEDMDEVIRKSLKRKVMEFRVDRKSRRHFKAEMPPLPLTHLRYQKEVPTF